MSTTELFVELIVVGLGAFAWIALLALAAIGIDIEFLGALTSSSAAAVPALALVYLFGIVTDRFADKLFNSVRVERKHGGQYPGGSAQFHRDRTLVLANSEQFARMYEYSRSRQRICRGWAFNGLALLLSFNVLLWVRLPDIQNLLAIAMTGSVFLFILVVACWQSWEFMVDTELKRVAEQAGLLRKETAN